MILCAVRFFVRDDKIVYTLPKWDRAVVDLYEGKPKSTVAWRLRVDPSQLRATGSDCATRANPKAGWI
jgi:hypothetical protein